MVREHWGPNSSGIIPSGGSWPFGRALGALSGSFGPHWGILGPLGGSLWRDNILLLLLWDMLDFQGCVFLKKCLSITKGPGPGPAQRSPVVAPCPHLTE